MSIKLPKDTGYYWAKWRIADDGTSDDDDITPSDIWTVVEVFMNCLDETHPEYLLVNVMGVRKPQSIQNFFWGEGPLKSPK